MKRLLLVCFFAAAMRAQQPGAATVTVGLFTTRIVHRLIVTPVGKGVWQQQCSGCRRMPLQAQVRLEHLEHAITLGGSLRIQVDEDATASAEAAGLYTVVPVEGGLRVTVQVDSERYVAAVLAAEAAPDEPMASLEALAIAARTFALANLHRHVASSFDLCDSTHCQALRFGSVRPAIAQAVRETAGITLWSGASRAHIYYTQHCGGISETAAEVWPSERASYLGSHADPYCLRRSPATWRASVPLVEFDRIAVEQHWTLPQQIVSVRVARRTVSGRAKLLELSGPTRTATISSSALHFAVNRTLGWNRIRSDLYDVAVVGDALEFRGRGYGHGVGLCQAGAYEMAREGRTAAEILAFYFPGTRPGFTSAGGIWRSERVGNVTLRTVSPEPELTRAVQSAWGRALALFPPGGVAPRAVVTLAPTTELFRQLSGGPGYLLAATRGDEVTLQPMEILKRNGPVELLLLHEFLHVLIESESSGKAPLWLREGLVEALADSGSAYVAPAASIAAIEQQLAAPSSLVAAQQAHRDAAAMVRQLGRTYSLAVMQRWLRDGVPPQVLSLLR